MNSKNKFVNWFKKFGAYCIAGGVVFTIALTIFVTSLTTENPSSITSEANNPVVSVDAKPVSVLTFTLPMNNATILKDYSRDSLFFNNTIGRWEFHEGLDFISDDLKVYAVATGTVSNIYSDYANGTVIEISHTNGLTSVYSSLNQDVLVNVGDVVTKGQEIALADDSAESESADGAHLHFEMLEGSNNIDPANYLDLEKK